MAMPTAYSLVNEVTQTNDFDVDIDVQRHQSCTTLAYMEENDSMECSILNSACSLSENAEANHFEHLTVMACNSEIIETQDELQNVQKQYKKQERIKREKMMMKKSMGNDQVRGDIILKAILRSMRRYYVDQFNSTTNYINKKRHKPDSFLCDKLKIYITDSLVNKETK